MKLYVKLYVRGGSADSETNLMHTITVCAYNRPGYLRCVLVSLLTAMHNACPDLTGGVQIVIGVDPGGSRQAEVTAVALQFAGVVHMSGWKQPEVIVWPEPLGVSEHPRRLLQHVFARLASVFNVHLEDDTVLSPDALRLAWWYWNCTKRPSDAHMLDKVICMSLHSRSGTDPALRASETVAYRRDFGVWGWCCTHLTWWLWLSHYWNIKREGKLGWDWSISWTMHENGLLAISPALSRVRNIGRENGAHQTPEGHDEEMRGLICAGPDDATDMDKFVLYPVKPERPASWPWGE